MKARTIKAVAEGQWVVEGAGVKLKRIFGFGDTALTDPFLLLDNFGSDNPEDYIAGFPWHPHRGIETITYMLEGVVEHGDSLGNSGVIKSGQVQWMTVSMPRASSTRRCPRLARARCAASSCGPTCLRRTR